MAKDKKQDKKQEKTQQDSRFQEVASDPRYLEMPRKQKKVVIDDRFKKALDKTSEFNAISKFDKTGKVNKQYDKSMQDYYRIEDKDGEDSNKFYDDQGNFQWQGQNSSSEGSASQMEEEGEFEMSEEEDDGEIWDEDAEIPYGETENEDGIGCRIALNKMDWDMVSALDILALFRSLCTGEKIVTKV